LISTTLNNILTIQNTLSDTIKNHSQSFDNLSYILESIIPECRAEEIMQESIKDIIKVKKANDFSVLTNQQLVKIEQNANLCPQVFGTGVYMARYLVQGAKESVLSFNDNCDQRIIRSTATKFNSSYQFKVNSPISHDLVVIPFNYYKQYNVEVFNITGSVVLNKTNLTNRCSIDLTSLSQGMYLVRISSTLDQSILSTLKIIKQ